MNLTPIPLKGRAPLVSVAKTARASGGETKRRITQNRFARARRGRLVGRQRNTGSHPDKEPSCPAQDIKPAKRARGRLRNASTLPPTTRIGKNKGRICAAMATLARRMTMLRHFAPYWSAVFLAASLLFCAAILLRPLTTGDLNPTSPMSEITEAVVLRTRALDPVASAEEAIRRHNRREDALVVRVSAGTR